MTKERILIVSQHDSDARELRLLLEFMGESVTVAGPDAWKRALTEEKVSIILLMKEMIQPLIAECIKTIDRSVTVCHLVVEGEADVLGATLPVMQVKKISYYLSAPYTYAQMVTMLQCCKEQHEVFPVLEKTEDVLSQLLVGKSPAIRRVRRMIQQVSQTDVNVMILGCSGTGKELVSQAVHLHSDRASNAFVPVNCGAIPGDLLESELFGHEKGAFTGAVSARQGRFELAQKGTLFLDEIGDMALDMQVKLLRVLQEKTFERVGSNKTIKADVRIITATHRNLEALIKEGKFREDLFYRLNVFPIEVPALRERTSDLPDLVKELNQRIQTEGRRPVPFTQNALEVLSQYDWPGNVRELANLVERLSVLYPGERIDVPQLPGKFLDHVSPSSIMNLHVNDAVIEPASDIKEVDDEQVTDSLVGLPEEGLDLKDHLVTIERDLILQALKECDGVVAHAAKRLNLRRTTLVEKIRKYQLMHDTEASNA